MKFKRLMAVLLSVAMVVGMMPALVFAEEIDQKQIVKVSADDPETKEEETQKPEEEKKPAKEDDKKTESDSGKKTEPEDKKTESEGEKKTESEGEKQPESEPEKEPETKEEEKPSADDGKKTEADSEEEPETKDDEKTEPEVKEEPKTEGEKKPETDSDKKTESEGEDKPKDETKDDDEIIVKLPPIVCKEDKASDNDALFKTFIENKLYGKKPSLRKAGTAGSRLTGLNKVIYDALVPKIKKVAEGEISVTEFEIQLSEGSYSEDYYTAADLGLPYIRNDKGQFHEDVLDKLFEKVGIDRSKINSALLADLPSELYWFDKTVGAGYGSSIGMRTNNSELEIRFYLPVVVNFAVAKSYSANPTSEDPVYETNLSGKLARVNLAKNNAQAVVTAAQNKSDYEKLKYYRDQICTFVEYDDDAAHGTNVPYGDPWQLISVFDDDSTTNVVCEGYSKAFKYLCDLTSFNDDGIECITVSGFMDGGKGAGRHMWNIVKMDDGKYYLVDVTNCDDGSAGNPYYLFLKGYTSGSYADGYTFKFKSYSIDYDYYDETKATYSSTWLTISGTDYVEPSKITTWAELQTALSAGGNIKLTQNITAGNGDTQLYTDKTVVLDLNGYIINRNLTTPTENGGVIFVGEPGNLTITDSRPDATHSPAIKYKDSTGNDVIVKGGIITGGYSNSGAGGIYFKWATGTINGGTIVGNKACGTDVYGNAGGIVIRSSTVTMNGGAICGNEAVYGDDDTVVGGVMVNDLGGNTNVFNINGGLITGNYTNSTHGSCLAGVYTYASKINISGKPQIYGNMKNGKNQNVIATNTSKGRVMDITGKLSNGARIGVTTWRIPPYYYSPEDFTSGYAAYHTGEQPSKYFTLDDEKAIMVYDGTTEPKVALKFTITVTADGNGSATVTPTDIYYDLHPTLAPTANKGYVFKEWQVLSGKASIDKDNRIFVAAEDADNPVTDIQIKAVFEVQKFTVTYMDGTSPLSTATVNYGEKITKPADPVKNGYRFNGWYSDPEFDHPFVFGTETYSDTTIYANFIKEYSVTVSGGTADITNAIAGEKVTVTAAAAPSGYVFDKWEATTGSVIFDDVNSTTTTFSMPEGDVSVTATFVQLFKVGVTSGEADKTEAKAGETVEVTADAAPEGYVFDKWKSVLGSVTFADVKSAKTTFIMPERNVLVKATYRITSGSCGDDLTWNIDDNGKLTISGTGAMQSWSAASDVPWVSIKDSIKEVVISEGVTTIESNAFKDCINLTGVTIPVSVTSIGDHAFDGCTSLTDVNYGGKNEEWNNISFGSDNDSLTNASIQYQKADNTFAVKGKTATVKYKKLKKKAQTLSVFKVLTFTNRGQGTLTYAKVSGSSKISINKTTGKITIKKKGLKKKKTYSVKVKVMAACNDNYNPSTWKVVTFRIKVK